MDRKTRNQFHQQFLNRFLCLILFCIFFSAGKLARMLPKNVAEINHRGQFHKAYGAKRTCNGSHSFAPPVSPTKLHLILALDPNGIWQKLPTQKFGK
jgi:hypothetical protein